MTVLEKSGLKQEARYVVVHCADDMAAEDDDGEDEVGDQQKGAGKSAKPDAAAKDAKRYYESIDLADAAHPQTILAYDMNDKPLPVAHGAPLRLRVERQLGYKMAKYLMRIEVVADFSQIRDGKGGYWEDNGYDWYAGI